MEKIIPAVAVLSTITFSSVFAAPPSQTPAEQNRYIDVQMLGINDLHGQLDTVKKVNNKEAGGADYLATYLKERKNKTLIHFSYMPVILSEPAHQFPHYYKTNQQLNF